MVTVVQLWLEDFQVAHLQPGRREGNLDKGRRQGRESEPLTARLFKSSPLRVVQSQRETYWAVRNYSNEAQGITLPEHRTREGKETWFFMSISSSLAKTRFQLLSLKEIPLRRYPSHKSNRQTQLSDQPSSCVRTKITVLFGV